MWFCNRECQAVARKDLGHRGANCRPADGAQTPTSSAHARSPVAAPSMPMDVTRLSELFHGAIIGAEKAKMSNTRLGLLAAAELYEAAASVGDLMGGGEGAFHRSTADQRLAYCLVRLGNMAAAARATGTSLQLARVSGNWLVLIKALSTCGAVAQQAPGEMVKVERESRAQERLDGSTPSHGGPDLSQEGRICLPTTPAALSRLGVTYLEATVAACEASFAAAGGRDSPATADGLSVPSLVLEAEARGSLGVCLCNLGEERQRGFALIWQAVALMRRAVRTAASSDSALGDKRLLAGWLCNLGSSLCNVAERKLNVTKAEAAASWREAAACLREALELIESTDDVQLKQIVLRNLANMSGQPNQLVGPAEAAALRSRLNALCVQTGRTPETSCTICIEPLEQPGGGAEKNATGDGGCTVNGYTNSAVLVLECNHQFHQGCLAAWWTTLSNDAECPLCMK